MIHARGGFVKGENRISYILPKINLSFSNRMFFHRLTGT